MVVSVGTDGLTVTMRQDRAPTDISSKYMNLKKTVPKDKRAHVAKFLHPIVVTKKIGADSLLQLTTFQSISSCNFLCINALNACDVYVREKQRGWVKKGSKQSWCIEMNEAQELYLCTYGVIDTMDHMVVKNCHMFYRTWKYWYAAMNLAKAMTIVIAYDMVR
jgi:hypothetical protein